MQRGLALVQLPPRARETQVSDWGFVHSGPGQEYSHHAYVPDPLPSEVELSGQTWQATPLQAQGRWRADTVIVPDGFPITRVQRVCGSSSFVAGERSKEHLALRSMRADD